jgi:acetyltransferase
VTDLDLNPLVADGSGVVVLDAHIRIDPAAQQPHGSRLVIRPYPRELEGAGTIKSLGKILIRPIKPEDAPPHDEAVD